MKNLKADFEEIITLDYETNLPLKFTDLPHGDWLLTYINRKSQKFHFKLKLSKNPNWTETIPHNQKQNEASLNAISPVTSFTQFFDQKGDLVMLYNTQDYNGNIALFYADSYSYGKSWNTSKCISPDFSSWKVCGTPIIIQSIPYLGSIILPVEDTAVGRALIAFSNDNGKTWNFSLYIEPGELNDEAETVDLDIAQCGTISPRAVEDNNLIRIFCWFKPSSLLNTLITNDLGAIWQGAKPLDLGLGCAVDAYDVIKLPLAGNAKKTAYILVGPYTGSNGTQISAWISAGDQINFTPFWAEQIQNQNDLFYCQCTLDFHGNVHLLYNIDARRIKHIVFNITDISQIK